MNLKNTLLIFFSWRIFLFAVVVLSMTFLSYRANNDFTNIYFYNNNQKYFEVLWPFYNFDGVHYFNIATRSYVDELRFMPLFPFTIFSFSKLTTLSVFSSGIFLSFIYFVFLIFVFYKLLELDYPKENETKFKTLLSLIFFPTSFFFFAVYTESLFLLLSLFAIFLARKNKFLLACFVGMFLSVTRLTGILIFIPILYEMYIAKKISIKNMSFFMLLPLLLFLYAYYNYIKFADPLFFMKAHSMLGNSRESTTVVFPLITLFRYFKILTTVSPNIYEFYVALIEVFSFFVSLFLLIFAYIKNVRLSYILYAIFSLSIPILSGTLTGYPRYMLIAFPMYILLGMIKNNKIFYAIIFVFALLQILLFSLFVRGHFVG